LAVESEHYSTASSNSDAPGPVGVGIPATAVVVAAAAAGEPVNDLTPKQLVPPQSPLMTAVPKGRSEAHTKGHGQKPRQPPPPVTPAAEGLTLFSNRIFCTKINNMLSDIVDLICRVGAMCCADDAQPDRSCCYMQKSRKTIARQRGQLAGLSESLMRFTVFWFDWFE